MPATGPTIVVWSGHALDKAEREAWVPTDVEVALLAGHAHRRANVGAADWLLKVGRLVVAYDWPADDDPLYARIVTVWRDAG